VSYANANTINFSVKDNLFLNILNNFDIVHTDGIGIYLALKFLKIKNISGFTGSDFYEVLIKYIIKSNLSCYFFGHDEDTLNRIQTVNPRLKIAGTHTGFDYDSAEVAENIFQCTPDILIIGLSQPLQEVWVNQNKDKLKNKILICVGDGIKVFAGTKTRGPVFVRKIGLEWLIRLIIHPIKYGKRYLIGNPLFLYRIIRLKIAKFSNHINLI
jgi:N-acetylglucosaminyldiphosphoundecaprenol N-acetyl-beta-D-mannosaminyltransferase